MNKINYELEREKQIKNGLGGKKLLLHSCCAPCSTVCIGRLYEQFDLTVYFYNPNIFSSEEYYKRADEQSRFLKLAYPDVNLIVEDYSHNEFLQCASGLKDLPEGGKRCEKCFELRLKKTFDYAALHGFELMTTTLTLSPLKNARLLNDIGENVCKDTFITWIYSDFKKQGGFLQSVQLSKKYGLYRQNYCGCEFSLR